MVEDGVVFNDSVSERTFFYQARLNLERFQRELEFKLYPQTRTRDGCVWG